MKIIISIFSILLFFIFYIFSILSPHPDRSVRLEFQPKRNLSVGGRRNGGKMEENLNFLNEKLLIKKFTFHSIHNMESFFALAPY